MSQLKLYNSLTRKTERFTPRQKGQVKLFTCGPSVYRRQHVGNYRTYLFEDVLHKYLRYLGLDVDRVINLTDFEDKGIREARQNGVSIEDLRRPVEQAFFTECDMLGIYLPDKLPRATTSVDSAVELIERLIDRGHAYWHEDEVFYDPLTYKGFGRLFGLDMDQWPDKKIRFRRDTYPGHRWNRGDFILWHKYSKHDGDVFWDTRIGRGRPAWNIQDAGMIAKHLGFEIDIHTGGIDNLYRHHDYTLAIMEGASGRRFCPWWLHGGHLLINGKKMSKSKGNVTYMDDLLQKGFKPRHIRFFLLYATYRDKLDLRISKVEEKAGRLNRLCRQMDTLFEGRTNNSEGSKTQPAESMRAAFEKQMNADLNCAGAFDALAEHLDRAMQLNASGDLSKQDRKGLHAVIADMDKVFGVFDIA